MSDIAKTTGRRIPIDGHDYLVRPLSRNVLRELDEHGFDETKAADMAPVELMDGLIGVLAIRLVPANGGPPARDLLMELSEERIGVGELVALAQDLAGEDDAAPPQ